MTFSIKFPFEQPMHLSKPPGCLTQKKGECEGVCFHWNGILGVDITRFCVLLGEMAFKLSDGDGYTHHLFEILNS